MTRFLLSFALAAPLALAACGDAGEPADAHAHHDATDADAPAEPTLVDGVQTLDIEAGRTGYQPRQIRLQAGVPARLVFTRTVEDDCSSQVTLPSYGVPTTDLPLNEPVAVEFTPAEAGEVEFVCGMDMQRGTIAVAS